MKRIILVTAVRIDSSGSDVESERPVRRQVIQVRDGGGTKQGRSSGIDEK